MQYITFNRHVSLLLYSHLKIFMGAQASPYPLTIVIMPLYLVLRPLYICAMLLPIAHM